MNTFTLISSLFSAFASNPTLTKYEGYVLPILGALMSGSGSLVLDGYTISIKTLSGTPVHFTLPQLLLAVENLVMGNTGNIVIGATEISFSKVV